MVDIRSQEATTNNSGRSSSEIAPSALPAPIATAIYHHIYHQEMWIHRFMK